jgi:hypothetical protein
MMVSLLANTNGQTLIQATMMLENTMGPGTIAILWLVVTALLIVALWRINNAANAAAPEHRTMAPGMVWLLLIPVLQVFWNFKALPAVSNSLAATLRDKGQNPGDCGRKVGIVWSVLVIVNYILFSITRTVLAVDNPAEARSTMNVVGMFVLLTWLAIAVCVVVYIVKVQTAKRQIRAAGEGSR